MVSEPFEAKLVRFFRDGQSAVAGLREGFGTRLGEFVSGLRQVLESARGEIREHEQAHASRFNVFDYISPDENGLSDILVDLLDPKGKHGQGAAFLELLLKRCEVKLAEPLSRATVHREAATTYLANGARRIDVRVDLGTFGIGIENKPWAADQQNQLRDYFLELDRRKDGRFLLLYLSGTGERPSKESVDPADLAAREVEGRFRLWTYSGDFADWLTDAEESCGAERVRSFLRDFREYVRRQFK